MKQQAEKGCGATLWTLLTLGLVILAITPASEGGCSRFGHSCFGAHGKRADDVDLRPEPIGTVPLIRTDSGRVIDYDTRISPLVRDWILGMRREASEDGRSKEFLNSRRK